MTLSPLEIYKIHLDNKEPRFFTQVPHILSYLSYFAVDKDGEFLRDSLGNKIRKRLSPIAKELYRVMKMLAQTSNACWASRDKLADLVNCSAGAISNAKKELCMPMEELGGEPLIRISIKNKRRKEGFSGKTNPGSTHYHQSTINFVWGYNSAFMETRKYHEEERKKRESKNKNSTQKNAAIKSSLSPHDTVNTSLSPHDTVTPGSLSPHDTNNNPTPNNNPSVITEQPTPEGVTACNSSKNDTVSVCQVILEQDLLREEHDHLMQQAEKAMVSCGCDSNMIKEFKRKYDPQRILDGGVYTRNQIIIGKKVIRNSLAYFRNAVENKRVWLQ